MATTFTHDEVRDALLPKAALQCNTVRGDADQKAEIKSSMTLLQLHFIHRQHRLIQLGSYSRP